MFWFEFNNYKNPDFGVEVVKRPNIPIPEKRVSFIQIAGRDGALTETDETYNDIEIEVSLNFIVNRDENFMTYARKLKRWLTGNGILKFSDDGETFYKVKNAKIDRSIERLLKRAGFFKALFTCDPYTYFESGKVKQTIQECRLNPYSLSKPKYFIYGNGVCTLFVNDFTVAVNVIDNCIIDTDLMMVYNENGEKQYTETRCDYEKLILNPGRNSISISNGFDLLIEPNWRSL